MTQADAPLAKLPFLRDKATRTILPPPGLPELEPAHALTMSQAAALMRGRGGKKPHVAVVRRWAGHRGWKAALLDDDKKLATWTVRLPVARFGRELLTMPAWVEWFEKMRVRFSTPP